MADDELDSLYCAQPDVFTAQRAELSAAAKRRGDDAAAKRISAARKPTAAAWMVNRLVLRDNKTRQRLSDLGDRLRDAHAAMDGERIRNLSAEQHKLINELARAAFKSAGVTNPSSAVREDVTGTLQAAIADPEVRARLGRLTKAERWSGFGGFADAAPASTKTRREPKLEKLRAAAAAAERAKTEADDELSARQADRDAARRGRDEALAGLREAERALDAAEKRYDRAKQASRAAAASLKDAHAQLKRAR
ncbi:hypothetical protein [Mycobacterium conspicuum]|uniref:Uncharacterized protein n=1 Tax=Mycobacterium conspicuum TaxID=44010 RepID=A0A1X1TQU4_9MYCO|nr:hypothetical protein [Mycobacterium conspicuum]ORV46952.1 hypothetical protein AWC00_02295 [Mycobacterium conspicuum]BBZ39835.1 hypothetical protein MCNS_28980 [Mycobacterium conspicuum]